MSSAILIPISLTNVEPCKIWLKGWKGPPLGWRIIHNPKVEVIEEEELVDGLVLSDDTI